MLDDARVLRDRQAQRSLIVATARRLAEAEGWSAVTTRRLSTEIGFSQPILYKHFSSMDAVVAAVALEGFGELAASLEAAETASEPRAALRTAAHSFCEFASDNPALYDAMFTLDSGLQFAAATTPAPMVAAFSALRRVLVAALGEDDADTRTEIFWASLHGVTTLEKNNRLRPALTRERIDLLASQVLAAYGSRA